MEINSATNVSSVQNGISQTNLLDKYLPRNTAATSPVNDIKNEGDKIILNRDFIAEFQQNKEKVAFGTVVEGYVNGKPAAFKVVSNNDEKEQWYEGALNKKYLLLHCKDKNYKGKYGTSEFHLSVDYNEPSVISEFYHQKIMGHNYIPDYFTVKGNIGEKEINITLPNAKIPTDSETKDLLTMILEDNGLKAQTINGEVKALKFSSSALKDIKKRAEKRGKVVNNDIKPIFMQGISTASGLIVGSVVSALLFKFGLKH